MAAYWDSDLEKNKETRPNGTPRYVIVDSKPMEGSANDSYNGITGLAFLRRFYQGMIDMTQALKAAGHDTGYADADIARWKDFLGQPGRVPDEPRLRPQGVRLERGDPEPVPDRAGLGALPGLPGRAGRP